MEIEICEVGPRDGLQNEKVILSKEDKLVLIHRLIHAGVKKVEVGSFVNPKIVPQMANTEEVIAGLPQIQDVIYTGLILSKSGLQRALNTSLMYYNFAFAISDSFNLKNARRTAKQSFSEIAEMIAQAKQQGKSIILSLATAFGCPFEGTIPLSRLEYFANYFIELGIDELVLADTTGVANPKQIANIIQALYQTHGAKLKLGIHLHNTRGLGLANALAAIQNGITRLDSSIGGIGGCPFAPKAVGNVCTDDLIYMLHEMGYSTGIDLSSIIHTSKWLETKLHRELDGMVMKTL